MRWWVLLLVGCDGTFGLTHINPQPDAQSASDGSISDASGADAAIPPLPMTCTTDMFTSFNVTEWTPYASGDAAVGAVNGELQIKTPTNLIAATGVEGMTRDYRGRSVAMTIRQYVATNTDNYLSLAAGSSNYYRIFANTSMLTMAVVTNGTAQNAMSIQYTLPVHRHWRIVHQPGFGVSFYTNDDGQSGWVRRHTVPELVALQSAYVDIGVLPYQTAPASREARFDDVTLCAP